MFGDDLSSQLLKGKAVVFAQQMAKFSEQLQNLVSSAPPPAAARRPPPSTKAAGKVGRNDKCPCGSGRKYKKCCEGKMGADDRQGGCDGGTPMVDDAAGSIYAGDAIAVRRLIDAGLNANAR